MIELISWKTRLLLVGYRDRVAWQQYQAANSGPTDFQPLIRASKPAGRARSSGSTR